MKMFWQKVKHYLFPRESNDYKAHVFRETSLGVLLLVVVGTFALGVLHQVALTNSNYLAAIYSGVLVDLANEDRSENSLSQLTINPVLEAAAKMKAEDMAEKGYFAHYGPDGSAPWDWMKKAGYNFVYAGENLAIDFTDSEDVDDAWMKSPTHRANILNSKFTEIGIATVKGIYKGRQTIYVVQMFGAPQNQVVALPVTSPVPVNQLAQAETSNNAPQVEGATSPTPTQSISPVKPAPKKVIAKSDPAPVKVTTVATSSIEDEGRQQSFIAVENQSTTTAIGEIKNSDPRKDSPLVTFIKKVGTNPLRTIETIYAFIGLIVLVGLCGVIGKDLETHHLKHAIGGVLLMVIIVTLGYAYQAFVYSDSVIVAMY